MATIEFRGIEEYMAKLARLGKAAEGVCKYAVYPAASLLISEIKDNTPLDTGDLRDSTVLAKFKNDNGFIHTQVKFDGYDYKGTPNAIKAAVLESGSSTRPKQPYIRPAVNRVRKQVDQIMAEALDKKITEIMESEG